MKTSFHRIYTKDKLELHGLLYQPDRKVKTALAHVHGMARNFYENRFLDSLAKILTQNDIAFSPFNNRGNGHLITLVKKINKKFEYVKIGNAFERFKDCILDIKAHLDFLENRGFNNIHLSGHSLGTCKATYYLAKTQDKRVKSLILLSPSDMLGLVREDKKRFKKDIDTAKKMIKKKRGDKLMPQEVWDEYPMCANTYFDLFGNNSLAAIFNFHNPSDKFKILSQISCPIFAIMGKKDDVLIVPIEKIMKIIKEKATSSPQCKFKILGNATHDYRGYEKELAKNILNWIKSF